MMRHEELHELAVLYALHALDAEDRALIEEHLATGCDACAAELRDARAVAGELAFGLAPEAPSRDARRALLERAGADVPAAPRARRAAPRRSRWLRPASIAAAAGLLATLGLGLRVRELGREIERARGELAAMTERARALDAERGQAQARVADLEASVAALAGPDTRAVALAGTESAPGAKAKAFVDPARGRLLLYVYDLPPAPEGRTYQLWVIVGDQAPVSAGTFDVRADGSARHDVSQVPSFEGTVTIAVTVEPAGGVPQPTGAMVLAGS
jgi:anti-sigma-K factor RskA